MEKKPEKPASATRESVPERSGGHHLTATTGAIDRYSRRVNFNPQSTARHAGAPEN
jgi:hypothetical protein